MKGIIRVGNTDIPGERKVIAGLSRIYGIGDNLATAICRKLNLNTQRKIGELTDQEVKDIDLLIKDPSPLPTFLCNRRHDPETGISRHLIGADLKLRTDFDVRTMKKLKTYKGIRHGAGLPVRGQRTKSHFRTGSSVGVMKKASKATPGKSQEGKKEGK